MTGRSLLLLAACLATALPATAADDGVEPVEACMRANLPEDSSIQDSRFVCTGPQGNEREILSTMLWKRFEKNRTRAKIQVHSPADLRNSALLMIERDGGTDLFVYVPELDKTRRVTTQGVSGKLFGCDFSYEDFQRLQGMAFSGTTERLPDADVDGVPVYRLLHRPAPESGSAYERVVSYVARDDCLLVKAEMWEPGERLRKVMVADRTDVFRQNGVQISRKVAIDDLKRGSSTRLELLEVDLERKVRRRDLDVGALGR